MTKDFLFEIGTEEIPAGAMPKVLAQVEEIATSFLKEERLAYGNIKVMGTPRRIALVIEELAAKASDLKERHKGPSVKIAFDAEGNPSKAAAGFARGKGIDVTDLIQEDGYIFAETMTEGKGAKEVAQAMLPVILNKLSFPKSMRWGNYDERFIRPVRWFVAMLDEEVLPFEMASAKSSTVTRGHRFLGEKSFEIKSPKTYQEQLRNNFIIVDQLERREMIVSQLETIASEKNGSILWDEDLLEEVIYLVEYPTALCGSFDKSYLKLPSAAVITPMKDHQRYFPMVDEDGMLMALFLTVRNGNLDHVDTVRAGNERVLRARLEDARFFFNEDRKTTLADHVAQLNKIVFQEGLGNMLDKTERLQAFGKYFVEACNLSADEAAAIERAAYLAKADLPTGMVTEFTELQGEMGKEYALLDGEKEEVANAIFEQYLPRFAGDILPSTVAGKVLSIADKVDNIVATFSRGLIPTGSQDPYALRRQTIGVLNVLMESNWAINLPLILQKSAQLLGVGDEETPELIKKLMNFFELRLKNIYLDRNWPHEVISLLLSRNESTVVSNEGMGAALLVNPIYKNEELIQSFTRIHNLVKEISFVGVDETLLVDKSEKKLFELATKYYAMGQEKFEVGDYKGLLEIPSMLIPSINDFFESVMIMDKNEAVKNNRLQLLCLTYSIFALIGDVSSLK